MTWLTCPIGTVVPATLNTAGKDFILFLFGQFEVTGECGINFRNLVWCSVREELKSRCFDFVEFWNGHNAAKIPLTLKLSPANRDMVRAPALLRRDLNGHSKAKRCYGWPHREGKDDEGERFVTILEIPPVVSPLMAVASASLRIPKAKNDYCGVGNWFASTLSSSAIFFIVSPFVPPNGWDLL